MRGCMRHSIAVGGLGTWERGGAVAVNRGGGQSIGKEAR